MGIGLQNYKLGPFYSHLIAIFKVFLNSKKTAWRIYTTPLRKKATKK